jgi:hypothetical protein
VAQDLANVTLGTTEQVIGPIQIAGHDGSSKNAHEPVAPSFIKKIDQHAV